MKARKIKSTVLAFVFLCVPSAFVHAGTPAVNQVMVTDVTPVSFSVVWLSSEASTGSLQVFEDEAGSAPAQGVALTSQPVESGGASIGAAAEDNGVLKVRAAGLAHETTYYVRTVTRSKSSGDVTLHPAVPPFIPVTTGKDVLRLRQLGTRVVPFTNDVVLVACTLPGGSEPAQGALVVADVAGAHSPVSGFAGDGVPLPYAALDLNNLYSSLDGMTDYVFGGEDVVVTRLLGIQGGGSSVEVEGAYVPVSRELSEMGLLNHVPPCEGDFQGDRQVDLSDLTELALQFGRNDCGFPGLCPGDLDREFDVDGLDLVRFLEDLHRPDCPAVE